ncbi:hypothetical protein [uncultured Friedmanniella sp.]|uniref:hypothetical protein n=1 Tax=uncultured Friedmanniella sp. TaxID=335381 RepID=UPI0035CC6D7A
MPTLSPVAPVHLPTDETVDASVRARPVPALLGALTGLVGLAGMARLAAGAFDGPMSRFAWVVVLAAMLPWVVYVASRARHGRLSGVRLVLVAALGVAGAATVWLSVPGPVLALVCSLVAFVLIWVSDWPDRRSRGEDRIVGIEELQRPEDD